MSTGLEGDALFYAAARAIGDFEAMPAPWLFDAQWLLVPAMLEWLRGRGVSVSLEDWKRCWVAFIGGSQVEGPDLPTALARLVLRVHELEQPAKGEGEKQ